MSMLCKLVLALVFSIFASIASAHSDGIYNPSANNVGNFEGIDSNAASSGSTLACTYTPVTTGTQNVAYTGATPSASGGIPAYTFSETGALPSGLTISSSTGVISGTPSVSGTFTGIQVNVADTVPTTVNCGTSFTLVIAPAFQGPGDVFTGAFAWYSCARVYNSASANTSTSMCDLVQGQAGASPGTSVGTLRGSATGFVDLSAYFPGSVTPSAACAAVTGGCVVSQMYDQTGNVRHILQATNSARPAIAFSVLNGLPVITGPSATTVLSSTGTFAIVQPITFSAVYERTAATTTPGYLIGASTNSVFVAAATVANKTQVNAGTEVDATANDNAWHGFQALVSGAANNCATNIDGSDVASLSCGTNTFVSGTDAIRIMRSNSGTQLQGNIAELGLWAATSTPTNRAALYNNQHGSNGYNGAF